MGAAWCRKRASEAQDSKSPLDRVIVRCVDKFYPLEAGLTPGRKGATSASPGDEQKEEEDGGSVRGGGSQAARVCANAGQWQRANLEVPREKSSSPSPPDSEESQGDGPRGRTPVPPPRKKRQTRRKVGVARPPPPKPPSAEDAQPIVQLLSPPKARPKHQSTVSLPNWKDLRPEDESSDSPKRPQYLRPPSMSSVSTETVERVETYLRRVRSFGSMPNGGLADKLSSLDASSDSDSDGWGCIDEFEHALHHSGSPPLAPRSRLPDRSRRSNAPSPPPQQRREPESPEFFEGRPAEDDWFKGEYRRESLMAQEKKEELTEVKKELQSIIFDYNRAQNMSPSSMEVLPTQPVRVPAKKISVVSITPPPSPVASDHEEDAAPLNGETSHSTLLKILRECQTIEGTLEQLGIEDSDMPLVHAMAHTTTSQKGHLKQPLKSFDSGLDLRRSLERNEEDKEGKEGKEGKTPAKGVDSGLDDSDDVKQAGAEVGADKALEEAVMRRRRAARPSEGDGDGDGDGDDGAASSGRSSMTPSLSELEAALSDMLEKNAAAGGEEDDPSPSPSPTPTPAPPPALPPKTAAPTSSLPVVHKTIPKISVTTDDTC